MYKIECLTQEDVPKILILWKKQGDVLGIPFKSTINKLIDSNCFFGIKENDKLIAMCGYKIMKRFPEIRITKLCVDEKYRRNSIATFLLKYVIDKTIDYGLQMTAECKDGVDNNFFYNHYGSVIGIKECKTMKVRKYKIDINKVMNG